MRSRRFNNASTLLCADREPTLAIELHRLTAISRAERFLVLAFMCTLPFVTVRVRGDGVGYYAYVRSLIVDHNLEFKGDWKDKASSPPFMVVRDSNGAMVDRYITATNHVPDYFAVGPALLWAPFVAVTHAGVLTLRRLGYAIAADGHGGPYLAAMAFGTALYGFLGLWLSFRLAREFIGERWAVLATVAIWFASSLPVYMYAEPSWSHAHSAFVAALFLCYWNRTSVHRTRAQWAIWGLISGVMCDVYFANAVFLVLPLIDLVSESREKFRRGASLRDALKAVFPRRLIYAVGITIGFLPTLIVRHIIFGNPLALGAYASRPWNWAAPRFWSILISPSRGLFTCTPVLILSALGLYFLRRERPALADRLIAVSIAFYALIAFDPWWDGVASFGSRFFVSLTPVFVLGLAAAFARFTALWPDPLVAMRRASTVAGLLIIWNLGLVFQWSRGLLPAVGPVRWDEVVYNQFRIVPREAAQEIASRLSPVVSPHDEPQKN